MSNFTSLEHLKEAVRRILGEAPNPSTAWRRIKGLPGPSSVSTSPGGPVSEHIEPVRGMHFDIPGEITVRFKADGSRSAVFTVATSHDDPNPTHVIVTYTPP